MAAATFPLSCFVGLAVAGVEVTVTGYARRPATLAYCADGFTIANTASLQWPHATAPWGTIDTVLLYDTATAGTQIAVLPALAPIEIRMYDIARIPASGIAMASVPIARPYGTGPFGVSYYGAYRAYEAVGNAGAFGVFGANGLGNASGRAGAFSARGYDIPTTSGVLMPGSFGSNGYGIAGGVPLERAFDQSQVHVCAPGTWAPGPFAQAA